MTYKAALFVLAISAGIGVAAIGRARSVQDHGTLASIAAKTVSGSNEAMHRVTEKVFRMSPAAATLCRPDPTGNPPHVGFYCHVFANGTALDTLTSGRGKYSTGSIIVKQKYSSKTAQNTELFTIMRKMNDGYDDDNANWEYSIVDPSGTKLISCGRDPKCISCHAVYRTTDFVSRVYLND